MNFTLPEWWPFGQQAHRFYRSIHRQQIISHEQLLCDEAAALGQHLFNTTNTDTNNEIKGEEEGLSVNQPTAAAFVTTMQQLHSFRAHLHAHGALAMLACNSDTPPEEYAMRAAPVCQQCGQSSFLASVVVDGRIHHSEWKNVCLECACVGGGMYCAAESHFSLLFVKPCWQQMVNLAQKLEPLLLLRHHQEPPSDSSSSFSSLSLAGCHSEATASPIIGYAWTDVGEPFVVAPSWVGSQPPRQMFEIPLAAPPLPPPPPPPVAVVVPTTTYASGRKKRSHEEEDDDDDEYVIGGSSTGRKKRIDD